MRAGWACNYRRSAQDTADPHRCKRAESVAAAIGKNYKGKTINFEEYTIRSYTIAHSQVISRTLSLSVRWSHEYIAFGIPVLLPFYKSKTCTKRRWTVGKWRDVTEEPIEQQRHELFLCKCSSCSGDQRHAWICRERRRRYGLVPRTWKWSVFTSLHGGQPSWFSTGKCQQVDVGKISTLCEDRCLGQLAHLRAPPRLDQG